MRREGQIEKEKRDEEERRGEKEEGMRSRGNYRMQDYKPEQRLWLISI